MKKVRLFTICGRVNGICDPLIHVLRIVYLLVAFSVKCASIVVFTEHPVIWIANYCKNGCISIQGARFGGQVLNWKVPHVVCV